MGNKFNKIVHNHPYDHPLVSAETKGLAKTFKTRKDNGKAVA